MAALVGGGRLMCNYAHCVNFLAPCVTMAGPLSLWLVGRVSCGVVEPHTSQDAQNACTKLVT